jgi:hypothetical protein
MRLGGEYRGFLAYVEVHAAHLLAYSCHHGHGWHTTLGVSFVQLLRRLDHRIEFLGPLVAVCCAAYLSLERPGESWSHGAYAILNVHQLRDHLSQEPPVVRLPGCHCISGHYLLVVCPWAYE